jgi:phosphoribosylformylglycinamidine cyclo-ligase
MRYEDCGVSVTAAKNFASSLAQFGVESTGFCSLIINPALQSQIIATSTDGVGTKLQLAERMKRFGALKTVGVDLVAMVVNDILTCGAKTTAFLDYFALHNDRLFSQESEQIMNGIALGCTMADAKLVGGETAVLPSMYSPDECELAGFGIGFIHADEVFSPKMTKKGDFIIGLPSSGPHSNGYSLINKIFSDNDLINDPQLRDDLISPTTIYSNIIESVIDFADKRNIFIKSFAHITGGGLIENVERSLAPGLKASIDWNSWKMPPVFSTIMDKGAVPLEDLRTTFNCGVGFVIICEPDGVHAIMEHLKLDFSISTSIIGEVV